MKKRTLFLSSVIGIILFACGGGGGGGNGTGGTGSTSYNTMDYFAKDDSKVYTYQVSETTSGDQQPTVTNWVYAYVDQTTIPPEYHYSGSIAAPYIEEILTIDGTIDTKTYKSTSGEYILADQSGVYTINDAGHTTITKDTTPEKLTIGSQFTVSSTVDLLSTDSETFGDKIYTMISDYTVTVLPAGSVIINGVTYDALNTQETTHTEIRHTDGTLASTINTSSSVWYGKGIGPVKIVANNTFVSSGGSTTSSVTSELASMTP